MKANTSRRLSRLTLLLGGAAALSWSGPAWAQEKAKEAVVEEVVITGSLFKQVAQGSQLVTTVDAEEITRTGATTAFEALTTIGQNQPLVTSVSTIGVGTGFASYANLRSLGSANTLVLFGGKRIVNNPYQSLGVDLNTLPLNVIDRIESLSDGASSIYGSDAIAGVINFIPKRELTGLSVTITRVQPEASGGENTQVSVAGGYGSLADQGWNIYAGYTWRDRNRLKLSQRAFGVSSFLPDKGVSRLQTTVFPANYSQGTTLIDVNPFRPACNPPFSIFVSGRACSFDTASQADLVAAQEDQSIIVHGAAKLGGHNATIEYLRGETDLTNEIASNQINQAQMSPNNPFFPGRGIIPAEPGLNPNANIVVNWRVLEAGPSTVNPVMSADRLLGQLDGEIVGWDYELWGLTSASTVELNLARGYFDTARARQGLTGANGAPFLNPFGPQSPAGAQFLRDIAIVGLAQRAHSSLNAGGAQVSRALFELPAGPLQFALAADYKEETASFVTDPQALRANAFTSITTIDASRKSYSLTSEIKFPILDNLEVDASLRYDHYSDFGGTTNPKVLVSWRPVEWLTVRGSYNRGFRAPTLYNVFQPSTLLTTTEFRPDPVLCPNRVVNTAAGGVAARDCGGVPFLLRNGGNPDLGPEKSKAYTFGLLAKPSDVVTIGVDYWNYHLTGSIAPLAQSAIFADLPRFGNLVVRCSQADPTLVTFVANCSAGHIGDPIAYVEQGALNLGDIKTSGIDLNFVWRSREASWGDLTFEYHGTYVIDYDFQRTPGGPFFNRAGEYFDSFPVLDYTHYATLTWTHGDWSAQLSNRFQAGYKDCNAQCGIAPAFFNTVNAYSLVNLAVTRKIGKATAIVRISNLFDQDPPFSNKTTGVGTSFDPRFADPIGRAYSLTLKYDW